jgi:hypothetical protein
VAVERQHWAADLGDAYYAEPMPKLEGLHAGRMDGRYAADYSYPDPEDLEHEDADLELLGVDSSIEDLVDYNREEEEELPELAAGGTYRGPPAVPK